MVQISFSKREILVKIVYYGMGLCGKTTSLQYLHSLLDPGNTTKLFSVKTDEDRTLFFDFLPITISTFNNFKIKLKIYTVPGQVKYSATRKAVLAGVDGVVFVVDSREDLIKDNKESFEDLKKNLKHYGLDRDEIPLVLQYNKRDLDDLESVQELNRVFNPDGKRAFYPSIAIRGDGLVDTFLEISKLVMESIVAKHKLPVGDDIVDAFLLSLRAPMKENESRMLETASSEISRDEDTLSINLGKESETEDDLLQQAVTSNIEMADLYDELEELKRSLELRVKELITANQISSTVVAELDADRVIQIASEAFQRHGDFGVSMLLDPGPDEPLRETMHANLKEDPLNNIILESGLPAARAIIQRNRVVLINQHKNTTIFSKVKGEIPEVHCVICIPLTAKRKSLGILNLYAYDREEFPRDTLSFYHLIANNIAIALENARLYKVVSHLNQVLKDKVEEINRYNEQLEDMVKKRTRELRDTNVQLEKSLQELRTLDNLKDDFMGLMSHELKTPLTSIISYSQSILEGMVEEEEERNRFLDVIHQESTHLNQIIERVIDTVNFENERAYIHAESTPVDSLVQQVLEKLKPEADAKQLFYESRLKKASAKTDALRAEQVLTYVVDNAIQHSPQGGTIAVSSKVSGDTVSVTIEDQGPGVSEKAADIIFDRFKLMGSLDHHGRGLRLSLHLARKIMLALEGTISLENPGEKGARFTIEFPKA